MQAATQGTQANLLQSKGALGGDSQDQKVGGTGVIYSPPVLQEAIAQGGRMGGYWLATLS